MNTYRFALNGAVLEARPAGTLWWPEARLLCVADLHLGKSERMARRGGTMLPPYETLDTLARLGDEIRATSPNCVVALGDSFDDLWAAKALDGAARDAVTALAADRDWVWIAGNHDPGPLDLPGDHVSELVAGPLTFRHIAEAESVAGEISGHYHPKARLGAARRRCFLYDERRLVMPAFGTYTGGLDCTHPDLRGLFSDNAVAVLTGRDCLPVPLGPQAGARQGRRANG